MKNTNMTKDQFFVIHAPDFNFELNEDELIDLAETIHTSVQDGKIPREERSMCMKKFWALVKAVEDSSKP